MKWGTDNQFQKLRAVLLARPQKLEIETPINPWQEKWKGKINSELALKQHENLEKVLKSEGVSVYCLETKTQKDARDLGVISSNGALVATQKHSHKQQITNEFKMFCKKNDIPILNEDTRIRFEGGDYFSINEKTAILGVGSRTPVNAKKIENILNKPRLQVIRHSSPTHLDAVFNIVNQKTIFWHKNSIDSKSDWIAGKKKLSLTEEDLEKMSSNYLILNKEKVLADANCSKFNKKLEREGIEVIEVDVSELKKNGGSIRCMTLPILRK